MKKILLLLVLIFLIPQTSLGKSFNRVEDLSGAERAQVEQFLDTDVRADFAMNWKDQLQELGGGANASTKERKLPWGDPLDPATQEVISEGIYRMLVGAMAIQGGPPLDHDLFLKRTNAILDYAARLGVVPTALTVGVMGRLQTGFGGSVGEQFNFYLDRGALSISTYGLLGAHAGPAAMAKIQFYIALCFGACFGGHATGWYLGLDVSADEGAGAGIFVEGGVILSDMLEGMFGKRKWSLKELYQTKAIYVGIGFDVGLGGGISADLFYYSLHDERTLLKAHEVLGTRAPDEIEKLQLH